MTTPDPATPGDVPLAELRPLLDDDRLSLGAVGIYAFLRSREREGNGPAAPDQLASNSADDDDVAQDVRDLVLTGYVHETEHGYLITERHRTA